MTKITLRPDLENYVKNKAKGPPFPKEITDETITQMRLLIDMLPMIDKPAIELAVIEDFYGQGAEGPIKFRFFDRRSDRHSSGPVVVFLHGGGGMAGSVKSHTPICTEIADYLDVPVVLPEYRIAPDHLFPAGPDDCVAFCRWLSENQESINREITGFILIGDSAGGTLTLYTAQALRDDPAKVPVILQVPLYGIPHPDGDYPSVHEFGEGMFFTREGHMLVREVYKPVVNDIRFSPFLGSFENLPPSIIVTTEYEVARDSNREYAKKLIEHGNEVVYLELKGMIHGFATMRGAVPSANDCFMQILSLMLAMIEK